MSLAQATVLLIAFGFVGMLATAAILAAIRWHASATAARLQAEAWQTAIEQHVMWLTERSDVTTVLQNVQAVALGETLSEKAGDRGPWHPKTLRDALRLRDAKHAKALPGSRRVTIIARPRTPLASAPADFDRTHPSVHHTA
ncbi:MAG: hypothetical protein RL456_1644 [Pseudomonadota bacterium]|jgi:Flp pilus assembly protein CpaB